MSNFSLSATIDNISNDGGLPITLNDNMQDWLNASLDTIHLAVTLTLSKSNKNEVVKGLVVYDLADEQFYLSNDCHIQLCQAIKNLDTSSSIGILNAFSVSNQLSMLTNVLPYSLKNDKNFSQILANLQAIKNSQPNQTKWVITSADE